MRRNRDDRDHIFAGAVVPENAVGPVCVVFSVSFEDVLTILAVHGRIFVRV
jgi:hypothetical protein